MINKRYMTG